MTRAIVVARGVTVVMGGAAVVAWGTYTNG